MISKNLYLQIVFRVLLLVATTLFLCWTIFEQKAYVLAVLTALVLLITTINLIYFLNRVNRRIFPKKTGHPTLVTRGVGDGPGLRLAHRLLLLYGGILGQPARGR